MNCGFVQSRISEVTSLKRELGDSISMDEVQYVVATTFQEKFNSQLIKGELTTEEILFAKELYNQKYSTLEWTLRSCIDCPEKEKYLPTLKDILDPSIGVTQMTQNMF